MNTEFCTYLYKDPKVDGVVFYVSCADLIAALGQGKNGYSSPNFRRLIDGKLVTR